MRKAFAEGEDKTEGPRGEIAHRDIYIAYGISKIEHSSRNISLHMVPETAMVLGKRRC